MQISRQMPDLCGMANLSWAIHQPLFAFDNILLYQFSKEILDFIQIFLLIIFFHICQEVHSVFVADGSQKFKHFSIESEFWWFFAAIFDQKMSRRNTDGSERGICDFDLFAIWSCILSPIFLIFLLILALSVIWLNLRSIDSIWNRRWQIWVVCEIITNCHCQHQKQGPVYFNDKSRWRIDFFHVFI